MVATNFLEAIQKWGAPQRLRTDAGTENGVMAAIQAEIHQDVYAHIFGPSTSNTRIEGLWSKMSSVISSWIDFFETMCDNRLFHKGHEKETAALRFSFMGLIRKSLLLFKTYWNTHNITATSDSPGGVPDVLFYTEESHASPPSVQSITAARERCVQPSVTGSDEIDEYLQHIMQLEDFHLPTSKQEGGVLYDRLLYFLNQH